MAPEIMLGDPVYGPAILVTTLERQEVERAGRETAGACGLTFLPVQTGEHVSRKLVGSASLASRRYAMTDSGFGFSPLWRV